MTQIINGQEQEPRIIQPELITPSQGILMSSNGYRTRADLEQLTTPASTTTHKIFPHSFVVNAVYDTLSLRKLGVTKDQYALSKDDMECYFVLDLDAGFPGGNFTLAGRNSHSKKFALGIAIGYRVKVCDNGMFPYDAVTRKHTSKVSLTDYLSVAIDTVMRQFDPLAKHIQEWRGQQLSVEQAKLCIYEAFIEERIALPKHLMRPTHEAYFNSPHEEFPPGNVWSLQNAFTYPLRDRLDPIPRQQAQAAIGEYFRDKKF